MKKMTLSAIVLGLAAAGAIAQTAPEATPAAAPAAQPTAEAAQPAAEEAKATEEAKKAEEAKAAEEAKKAEEAKAAEEAKKAEEAKAAEEAKKAEEAKAAEEAKKAEEAKAAEAENGETAGTSFVERLNISKADPEPAPTKAMEFKVAGQVEFDAYADMDMENEKKLHHSYSSTADIDFQVKFNDKWSAQVELEADGESTSPASLYNGAFAQYQKNENFAIKFGDLTYAEGAFNYYGYDDPAYNAAGMKEHDIRGIELDLYGLQLGLGFGRGNNDIYELPNGDIEDGYSYDVHAAYQLEFAGQALRPFAHYKSWQQASANELHAGLEANLEFGPFAIHAVYGLHADRLNEDEPKATHAVLAEPSFKVANVNIRGGFFYASIDEDTPTIHGTEIPEYMFAYGEGIIHVTEAFGIGLLGELHTNSLYEDTDLGTLNFGTRLYFTPVDGLEVTGFAMGILPMGSDWEKDGHGAMVSTEDYGDDMNLRFGAEAIFSF